LPYYEGSGPFATPELRNFTKRLVFSCWKVVPKAIATVLSYEAERHMMQHFRKKAINTSEARKRLRALLRFAVSKGRPSGMPTLAMLYPCRTLADRFDPLHIANQLKSGDQPATEHNVRAYCAAKLKQLLFPIIERLADTTLPADERWYWAAPLLLDKEFDGAKFSRWFAQPTLPQIWSGDKEVSNLHTTRGWTRHVKLVKQIALGQEKLGSPPEDLADIVAALALAGPGVVAMRMLERVMPDGTIGDVDDIRNFAGPLAHAFLHLFNLPEVMCLLRDRKKEMPYWQSVLNYCVAGNLQASMDDFAHMLIESVGLIGESQQKIAARLQEEIEKALTIKTATAKADVITANRGRVHIDNQDALRLRTRFAMRFGDQIAEDSAEPTRADQVRAAFNSPFWPFVLATTSVGQEGLDFHPYCHAVVHWNLPSNPVDLEQREGRVHRYKGHALRKNISALFSHAVNGDGTDPWARMFAAAKGERCTEENDLYPFWIAPNGMAKIERHVPAIPLSRDLVQKANLARSLVLYRMVFGQNRQEDLLEYLANHLKPEKLNTIVELCRIDLSPPKIH
jgi:hypothetical protein